MVLLTKGLYNTSNISRGFPWRSPFLLGHQVVPFLIIFPFWGDPVFVQGSIWCSRPPTVVAWLKFWDFSSTFWTLEKYSGFNFRNDQQSTTLRRTLWLKHVVVWHKWFFLFTHPLYQFLYTFCIVHLLIHNRFTVDSQETQQKIAVSRRSEEMTWRTSRNYRWKR